MGTLATRIDHIDSVGTIIKVVLTHFSKQTLPKNVELNLAIAADLAFSDNLLYEKFQIWHEEHDDEVLLFHIKRFFEKKDQRFLSKSELDLTSKREEIESSIKENVRNRQKQIFGIKINELAANRNLLTNKELGDFLGVSEEQARKYKNGENKPQLATLKDIADRFKVTVEFLLGF